MNVIKIRYGNADLLTYYDYPEDIHSTIYSTNLIEGFNKQVKRETKAETQFSSANTAKKCLVSLFQDHISKQGTKTQKGSVLRIDILLKRS